MDRQIHAKSASTTSKINAWMRALGTFEKDEKWKCVDYQAIVFLNAVERLSLNFFLTRRMLKKKFVDKGYGGYQYQLARTKIFDNAFIQALQEGFDQIVLLGAGYDTRSYRFKDTLKQTKIFEIDMAATQKVKKACLQQAKIDIPDNVTFMEMDLIQDNLEKGLFHYGYNKEGKTLFVCEGILMYLTENAVNTIFEFMKSYSPRNSSIVFDFLFKSALNGSKSYYGSKQAIAWVESVGEKFVFGIEESKLKEYLACKDLNLIHYYDPELLEKKFLVNNEGESLGKTLGFHGVCVAKN